MFESEILESLPADSEEAFAVLELQLREKLPPHKEFQDNDEQRAYDFERAESQTEYVLALAAFAHTHELDIGVDFAELMMLREYEFIREFEVASRKIKFFANMCAFKLNQKRKSGTTCIYVIEDATKLKIRAYLDKVRNTLTEIELTDLRKEALFSKLNAFASELDKDRTRLEAFASFYVSIKTEAKELSKIVEPVEKIWTAISSGGKELWKALPGIEVSARIGMTPKIEDHTSSKDKFDLDDEIPF